MKLYYVSVSVDDEMYVTRDACITQCQMSFTNDDNIDVVSETATRNCDLPAVNNYANIISNEKRLTLQ